MFRIFVMAILFNGLVGAQNFVEERTYASNGAATPRIDGLFTKPLPKNFGTFVWFQVQQGYSQAYAGATYSPKPFIQFALGAGIEEDKNPARIGSYVWVGKGKVSTLAVFEDGGSGFWYKVETNYQLTRHLGLGTMSESYKGHGPKVEFALPRLPVKLWASPLWQKGPSGLLIGLRWSH